MKNAALLFRGIRSERRSAPFQPREGLSSSLKAHAGIISPAADVARRPAAQPGPKDTKAPDRATAFCLWFLKREMSPADMKNLTF